MQPPPEGYEPHFRKSKITDPWEPIYSRRTEDAVWIGLWAGEKMGLSGESIESYALALGKSTNASEEDVIRKIVGDLTASRIVIREAEVRVKAAEFLAQSREAIKAGA